MDDEFLEMIPQKFSDRPAPGLSRAAQKMHDEQRNVRPSLQADITNVWQHHLQFKAEIYDRIKELAFDIGRHFTKQHNDLQTQINDLKAEVAALRETNDKTSQN